MNQEIISKTKEYVKETLKNAEGGHDWFHIERVYNLSKTIGKKENANMYIVELGALLHDIADSKFHNGDEEIGPRKAREWLYSLNVEKNIIKNVKEIVRNISFKGGKHTQNFNSLELDVVQDADRLDAIGAIGIARTFNYGGYKGREIYDPNINPNLEMTKEEYKKSNAPTINHFYEKLLLLKDKMNTKTGTEIAKNRHLFMENFLSQFYQEWNGET